MNYCPDIHMECLDQPPALVALEAAGATETELEALRIITQGRSLTDVTSSGDFGAVHFDGQGSDRDPLDLGVGVAGPELCAVLYSEHSAAVQLSAWRGRVAPVRDWVGDPVLSLTLANSTGARGFLALAESCGNDEDCILERFGSTSRHRARRAAALKNRHRH